MCSDEDFFDVYCRYPLICFSPFVVVIMGYAVDGVYKVSATSSFPMIFDEICFVSYFGTLISSEMRSDIIVRLTSSSLCL